MVGAPERRIGQQEPQRRREAAVDVDAVEEDVGLGLLDEPVGELGPNRGDRICTCDRPAPAGAIQAYTVLLRGLEPSELL